MQVPPFKSLATYLQLAQGPMKKIEISFSLRLVLPPIAREVNSFERG